MVTFFKERTAWDIISFCLLGKSNKITVVFKISCIKDGWQEYNKYWILISCGIQFWYDLDFKISWSVLRAATANDKKIVHNKDGFESRFVEYRIWYIWILKKKNKMRKLSWLLFFTGFVFSTSVSAQKKSIIYDLKILIEHFHCLMIGQFASSQIIFEK
jgi:hypothetical protein